MGSDIIERLAYWRDLPHGAPLPEKSWDRLIAETCAAAITEIEELRARVATLVIFTGATTSGPDLREIKDGKARDAMR